MKPISNTWRLMAVAAASALVVSACGGGSSDDDETDPAAMECEVPEPDSPIEIEGDGAPLVLGMLLPQTGQLAYLGPPEFAGVNMAIREINAAGGVFGEDVEGVEADSGDGEPNIAPDEVDNLFDAGSQVIIGAAASGVSFTVIDKITNEGVVQFSPANTSPDFDTYDHGGLYFRTAPSDILQGSVIVNTALEDGINNLAVLARQDDYGEALADVVEEDFEAAGGTITSKVLYDPTAATFDSEVQQIADGSPDGVVVIGFEETANIIPSLDEAGAGAQDAQLYFVDGNLADYSSEADVSLPEGILDGVKGTQPGGERPAEFDACLLDVDPDLRDFNYSAESYDAAIVSALAALQAGSTEGEDIAAEIADVTGGEGESCTVFHECAQLIADGEAINYDGVSGPIEIGDTGSPTVATIGVYTYEADNTYQNDQAVFVEGTIE